MGRRFDRNDYNIDWTGVKKAVDYYKAGRLDMFGFYMEKSIPDLVGFEKLLPYRSVSSSMDTSQKE